jgi:hypothetical protein
MPMASDSVRLFNFNRPDLGAKPRHSKAVMKGFQAQKFFWVRKPKRGNQ